jgi:transglutaminase-like putative cysteine protease
MKKALGVLFLLFPLYLFAQDYKVSLIPDSLLKDADAVKRFEEWHITIKAEDRAIVKHRYAYTILNESGEEFAIYSNYYDKFHSLSDVSGTMYDANGKSMKSIRKKDIADVAADDGESLVSDARTKHYIFYNKVYPYTVEFEDELDYSGIFSLPVWLPIDDEKLAVQKSIFTVETPADYHLRYKQFNYSPKPNINATDKKVTYTWEISNQKAKIEEEYHPDWHEITPTVLIAPTDFEFGGYKGNMSSWNNLGKFIFNLYDGRDNLPDELKKEVHRITDGLSTKEEKINALYYFMQKNTRYISIQLGIGGLQPFEAKYVAEKKYGDCKALSNYMVGLLKEAGIKANWVIISAGEGRKGLFEDFPCNQFNHVVVCIPNIKDSIWLECTNQTVSPGYMGNFTGNRKALLISETGGYVVKTPNYASWDNLQLRKVDASIDDNGNLIAEVKTRFTGTQQELQHSLMYDQNSEQREKYLNNALNLPTYKVEKSEYKEIKGRIPVVDEYLKITAPSYASVTGKRIFILPNLFNRGRKLATDKPRQFDVEFRYSFRDVDTIQIKIPDGYTVESMPSDMNLSSKFGKYRMVYKVSNNLIELLRINERSAGVYPVSDYKELASYFEQIYKADRTKMVLVKKD